MTTFRVSPQQVLQFHEDGYLIVPQLFNKEETALLFQIAKGDREMDKAGGPVDTQGAASRLRLRNELFDDIYSACVQCERMVNTMETLLQDEVYHFHHKMMLKEPRVGGAWEWHQDYGYWYKHNHCLYPDMASAMIAVDSASKANGCLQVLKGTHKCGRIEHGVVGTQTGADQARVDELAKRHELVYVELNPGDVCFFHSNLLHRSDQNRSDHARWTLICCYNTRHNDPFQTRPGGHPNYHYLHRLPDEKVLEIGQRQWKQMQDQLQTA